MGLHFGNYTTSGRGLTTTKRGNCTIRGATRRRQADSQLLMLQNPQYHQHGSRPKACRPCPQCPRATESRHHGTRAVPRREKTRPAQAAHHQARHKTRPLTPHAPFLTRLAHARRVMSRFCRQQAPQGRPFSRTSPSTITGLIETTPQHDTPSGAMKHFPPQLHTPHRSMKHLSPQHATNDPKSPISPTQGRTFFHNTHHPHNTHPRLGDFSFNHQRQVQANQQSHAIPIRPIPTQPHNPQDSNDQTSHHETHLRELHAKLLERWDQATVPVGGEPAHLPTTLISDGGTPNKNRT